MGKNRYHRPDNWVVVYTTVFPQDIYPARNLLESEGITTFIRDELTAQVYNFYSNAIGGVKLLVHSTEFQRSLELLVRGGYIKPDIFEKPPLEMEVVDTPDRSHCPYCGSAQISRKRETMTAAVIMYYVIGLVLPIFRRTYMCGDCGRSWKFGRKREGRETA